MSDSGFGRSARHDGGWRRRASRYLFESRWFRLRQDDLTLPNGDDITYTLVEHAGWVMVVPWLADGRVVMERVYRHTVQRSVLECPSGGCDGEPPEVAARRELEEETGYLAQRLVHLGRFAGSSGISSEEFDVYLAPEPRRGGRVQRENTEQMEIELIPLEDLREIALRGEIFDAPSALALLLAAEHLRRG
jgi:8-oxo-dGTP pyrophosphatase MutT (NUDIX family)